MADIGCKKTFDAAVVEELEAVMAQLEKGEKAFVVPSGTSAVATTLMLYAQPGNHFLVSDSVYHQTRQFCEGFLKSINVAVTYYSPAIGEKIINLIQPNTKLIFCESPGSWTFEVQDVPTLSRIAHEHNITVVVDNTWATPLLCNPLLLGADIVIHSLSKYVAGYDDVTLGIIVTSNKYYSHIKKFIEILGIDDWPKSESCYMALRGLQTLAIRLSFYQENAEHLIKWLGECPQVEKILYPALPGCVGHQYWKRDFKGSSGLLGFTVHPAYQNNTGNFLERLKVFQIRSGWGGYQSLIQLADQKIMRSCEEFSIRPRLFRISVGAENSCELISDLEQAFKFLS